MVPVVSALLFCAPDSWQVVQRQAKTRAVEGVRQHWHRTTLTFSFQKYGDVAQGGLFLTLQRSRFLDTKTLSHPDHEESFPTFAAVISPSQTIYWGGAENYLYRTVLLAWLLLIVL